MKRSSYELAGASGGVVMERVRLSEWGSQLLGRELGAQVHAVVAKALEAGGGKGVTIDCAGVRDMTLSFADELFGRLSDRPRHAAGGQVRVENIDPAVRRVVLITIEREKSAAV